jgi:serine phosphatase RsbU (regulator of sigma subunit)
VALRKSTKVWLAVFAASLLATAIASSQKSEVGCIGASAVAVAIVSGCVLVGLGAVALFRLIVRRIALRLAFSYFLIGVVPIPLLLALLFAGAYLLAHRLIATRLHREVTAVVEKAAAQEHVPEVVIAQGSVVSSDVPWLKPGSRADWASASDRPRPVLEAEEIWFVVPAHGKDAGRFRLVFFNDPSAHFLQSVADRSGYEVRVGTGRSRAKKEGYEFHIGKDSREELSRTARPSGISNSGTTWTTREWLFGVSVEPPIAFLAGTDERQRIVLFLGRTSPRVLFDQLFEEGVPEIGRVFWAILAALAGSLLLVYLIALTIAFVLIGSIARNVNRLSRATEAVARGDFSVRVGSRSRDQIGNLARSFDGMAASMERLLVETAEKKRLEGQIAAARTIQQKLLPPPEASLPGLRLIAHFQPAAEIGGDYYDYLPMPDGRTAVAIGDVSGHGLPTGLLVAMAKAALTTQIESGLTGSALFTRLNELIHRSTDSRNYMTLSLLAYDPATRRAQLTNAGQLGPYRISAGTVESLSLPSFPLGVSQRDDFPTRPVVLAPGDRLVLLTDGLVEAANSSGEPFGFERLEALLKVEAASEAERIRQALLQAVESHTGSAPPDDDRTLVILTVT